MYKLKNKVQLIGRAGNQPEIKQTASGKKYLRLSMATNEKYKNAGGEDVEETQWHQVVAWGKLAELMADLVEKGQEILVTGKIKYHQYEDAQGVRRYATDIVADEFLSLSGRRAKG